MNYGREIDCGWQILPKNWADGDSRSLRGAADVLFFLLETTWAPTWESIIPCTPQASSLVSPTFAYFRSFGRPSIHFEVRCDVHNNYVATCWTSVPNFIEIVQADRKLNSISRVRLNFRRRPILCTTLYRNLMLASNFGGTFDQPFLRIFL